MGGGREIRMLRRWAAAFLLLALVPGVAHAGAEKQKEAGHLTAAAKPRELSEAEHAAIELAVAYLQRGPEAWWERLAAGAPWRRLGKEAALREIAARAGPADGAQWQLLTPGYPDSQTAVFGLEFASGLDETLTLRLIDEGGWKLAGIETSADPVAIDSLEAVMAPGPWPQPRQHGGSSWALPVDASGAPAASAGKEGPAFPPLSVLAVALATLLLGAVGVLLLVWSGRRAAAFAVGVLAVLLLSGPLFWAGISGVFLAKAKPAGPDQPVIALHFGSLAPLRAALAAGTDRAEIEKRLAEAPDPKLREVHALWRAQSLLGDGNLNGAEAILRTFPENTVYPLAELLRARLAFRRLRREETGRLYDRAIRRGTANDGLRLESAIAKALTDDGDRAEVEFTLMVEMGSRLAEAWYAAAEVAATQDHMEEAEALLRQGWQLEPAPRAELFGNPLLAFLVARPSLFPLFQLEAAAEPRLPPAGAPRPLVLPAEARVATCGQSLRLALGGAELLVPGGALLAPQDAVLEDADTWSRHAEAKALAALPSLSARVAPGETLPPRLLRLAEQAGGALARQNRWSELARLTEPLDAGIETAPADLVRLRARALHHLERNEEARQLLIRLAKTDIAGRRPAAGTLFELAELFAAAGEYDTAIKLLQKADSQLPVPRGEKRRRQLAMDRELATSYESYRTEHFDVRYPKATGDQYAKEVGWVLEEEHRRLQRWIPAVGGKRIEVHLFPLRQFFSSFSGNVAVVGLFDGKVRVPFADLRSLHPELVAILSHEVAHAMIAAATRDQAPHWLQEGLAQHIEMGTKRMNPLPDLARTKRSLSFPTVDPILRGFAEEQLVELAYAEAAWSMDFVETRFGEKSIHRLLTAFAAGKTTDQALRDVFGLSSAEFDRAFWKWGTTEGPQTRMLEARRYDEETVRQERQEARANRETSLPRAGLRPDLEEAKAHGRERAEEQHHKMAEWYATYRERTAGVKRALTPILQAYRGTTVHGSTAATCAELSSEVTRVLAEPEPWASADPYVNRSLRKAYLVLGDLGLACRSGKDAEVRLLISKTGSALGQASQLLAPYGLTP